MSDLKFLIPCFAYASLGAAIGALLGAVYAVIMRGLF